MYACYKVYILNAYWHFDDHAVALDKRWEDNGEFHSYKKNAHSSESNLGDCVVCLPPTVRFHIVPILVFASLLIEKVM